MRTEAVRTREAPRCQARCATGAQCRNVGVATAVRAVGVIDVEYRDVCPWHKARSPVRALHFGASSRAYRLHRPGRVKVWLP